MLVTEISEIVGVSALFGIFKWITVPAVALILILISYTGKYKIIEKIAIFVGIFELVCIPVAIFAKSDYGLMLQALMGAQPLHNNS